MHENPRGSRRIAVREGDAAGASSSGDAVARLSGARRRRAGAERKGTVRAGSRVENCHCRPIHSTARPSVAARDLRTSLEDSSASGPPETLPRGNRGGSKTRFAAPRRRVGNERGEFGKDENLRFLENVRSRIILFPTKKEKRKILFAAGRIQETRQSPSTPAAPTPFRGKTKGCDPQKGTRHGRRQVAAGRRRDAPNRLILRARAPNAAKSPTASFPKRPHSPAPRPFLPAPSPPRARRVRRSCPPPRPWR